MEIGKLIGKGMTAEVYEYGEGKVLKLFYNWVSMDWVRYEADVGENVYEAGVPAPIIYGTTQHEGRSGLICQRIVGTSMLKLIDQKPWKIRSYAKRMARLHAKIHLGRCSKLPRQKDALERGIRQSAGLLGDDTERIVHYLRSLPDGVSVCHGDFHPDNIISSGNADTVIDWTNAYSGDPCGDVARTCLMTRSPFIVPGMSRMLRRMIKPGKRMLLSSYLQKYKKLTGVKQKDIDAWMLPVAAARLRERIPGEEDWLLDIIHTKLRKIVEGKTK
jgi:tRNA A-37 threonylcarbamoyl transferase component Bud32